MLYELRIDCFFLTQDAMKDILEHLDRAKPDMTVINPGQPDQQCSVIDQIECHHDESPHAPCYDLVHWDNCPLAPSPPPP